MANKQVDADKTPVSCAFPAAVHLVWVCVCGGQCPCLFVCLNCGRTCTRFLEELSVKWVVVVVDSCVSLS